jgi:glycosyltransferase involved in cell wall biosynthesis
MGSFKKIKIAFISSNDTLDKKSLSGSSYRCAEFLKKYYGELTLIHNFRPNKVTVRYLIKNLFRLFTWIYIFQKTKELCWKMLGKGFVWEKTPLVAWYYAKSINKQLRDDDYDIIFSDKGSFCIAYLDTKIPIIYNTDTTFKAMEDYYPEFMRPPKNFSRGGNEIERLALEKSAFIIASSEWAANSMVQDYNIKEEKIRIIPYVTNIDESISRDIVLKDKDRESCKLLFVGTDWVRKGGDIAVEATDWLKKQGVCVRLIICGCQPPKKYLNGDYPIDIIGFLDKNTPGGNKRLEELFMSSHFLILPTRAECLAQVLVEASAYGLPSITSNTGGASSAVVDGQNGILMDINANGGKYGKVIKEIRSDIGRYRAMCVSARDIFEKKFSAKAWRASMDDVICNIISRKAGNPK